MDNRIKKDCRLSQSSINKSTYDFKSLGNKLLGWANEN